MKKLKLSAIILVFAGCFAIQAEEIVLDPEKTSLIIDMTEELGIGLLDLNSCPAESLLLLPYMDYEKALIIIRNRPHFSVETALYGAGFSFSQIELLKNFFFTGDRAKTAAPFHYNFRTSLSYKEFDDSLHRRQPFGDLNYVKIERGSLSFSLSAGLDPGENGYPDFLNACAVHFGKNITIIAGTQRIQTGAGLLFSGASFGTAVIPSSPYRISPYAGYAELGVPAGLSVQMEKDKFAIACLAAFRFYDAALDSAGNALRLDDDGYHASSLERERKRNFRTAEADLIISYGSMASVVFNYASFSRPLAFDEDRFNKNFKAIELVIDRKTHKSSVFIDISRSEPGDIGAYFAFSGYTGILKTQLAFFRYGKDYKVLFSAPPSELGPENEQGVITSLSMPFSSAKAAASFMYFQEIEADSIEKKFRTEFGIDLENRFTKDISLSFSSNIKRLNGKYSGFPGINPRKESYSFSLDFLRSSLAYHICIASDSAFREKGEAFSVKLVLPVSDMEFILHACSYSTPSFASVIYIYQPQNPGSFGFLNAYGEGEALRLMARKKSGHFHLSFFADITGKHKSLGAYFDVKIP